MGYYSDPTAAQALGDINREFARLEKKAKNLRRLLEKGRISSEVLAREQEKYKGIYRHVLNNVLDQPQK